MLFFDKLTLDAPKKTKEGFLATRARAARAGIYDYLGRELDPEGKHFAADQVVKVWRSPEEVFSRDSVHSFLLKPITDDHPSVPVTADNWKSYARGVNAGAMRDGDFLAFDLVLMDTGAIQAVDAGKKELSNGYSSDIIVESGQTPDGQHFDARQTNIRGNHIALVKAGRAGPECRIGDAKPCDSIHVDSFAKLLADGETYRRENNRDNSKPNDADPSGAQSMNTFTIDGIPFEMSDQAIAAVKKLQGQRDEAVAKLATAETSIATLTTDKATLEAEKATLAKQLDDSKLSPQALRDAAKAYQATVDKAKALGIAVTDAMDEAAIIKACVSKHVGDVSKDWNDAQLAASFASLKTDARQPIDPVREALSSGSVVIGDTQTIRNAARDSRYAN
jgi:hypothetical protein